MDGPNLISRLFYSYYEAPGGFTAGMDHSASERV
jgi:hypothetical protein